MPVSSTQPALRGHSDLLKIMELVKEQSSMSKKELMRQHFAARVVDVPGLDQDRAFNLAASILLSLNCGVHNDCADNLEDSADSFPWTSGMSVQNYVDQACQKKSHIPRTTDWPSIMNSDLTAKNLKNKAGLSIEATDDLRSHLRLDPKTRIVYVFDCTAQLEEMLEASRQTQDSSILPRELLLEVLQTIYKILFPFGRASKALALHLTKKNGFQEGFLRYRINCFRRDDDPEIDYSYFGDRLVELKNELKDSSPRNWFERLFEGGTRSAERKMLMATTIGVFIAVTIGLFGLIFAAFQAWVGYQQWKHPAKDG